MAHLINLLRRASCKQSSSHSFGVATRRSFPDAPFGDKIMTKGRRVDGEGSGKRHERSGAVNVMQRRCGFERAVAVIRRVASTQEEHVAIAFAKNKGIARKRGRG